MPPYLCYRNFTLHSDCLGIVTIPEIYKYVTSIVCTNSLVTVNPTTGPVPSLSAGVRLLSLFRVFEHQVELELKHGLSFYSSKAAKNRL